MKELIAILASAILFWTRRLRYNHDMEEQREFNFFVHRSVMRTRVYERTSEQASERPSVRPSVRPSDVNTSIAIFVSIRTISS